MIQNRKPLEALVFFFLRFHNFKISIFTLTNNNYYFEKKYINQERFKNLVL